MVNPQQSSRRSKQVAHEIRAELVDIIQREIRDPRLKRVGMITISGLDLADDYRNATVWVSFMGKERDSTEVQEAIKALQSADKFIHRLIVKRIAMKMHPRFYFKYDPMFEKAEVVQNAFQEMEVSEGKRAPKAAKQSKSTNSKEEIEDELEPEEED